MSGAGELPREITPAIRGDSTTDLKVGTQALRTTVIARNGKALGRNFWPPSM
jgi:hypothetical protein